MKDKELARDAYHKSLDHNKVYFGGLLSHNFTKLFAIGVCCTLIATLFLWVAVDLLNFWVVPSSIAVYFGVFVVKYQIYKAIKILKGAE